MPKCDQAHSTVLLKANSGHVRYGPGRQPLAQAGFARMGCLPRSGGPVCLRIVQAPLGIKFSWAACRLAVCVAMALMLAGMGFMVVVARQVRASDAKKRVCCRLCLWRPEQRAPLERGADPDGRSAGAWAIAPP